MYGYGRRRQAEAVAAPKIISGLIHLLVHPQCVPKCMAGHPSLAPYNEVRTAWDESIGNSTGRFAMSTQMAASLPNLNPDEAYVDRLTQLHDEMPQRMPMLQDGCILGSPPGQPIDGDE